MNNVATFVPRINRVVKVTLTLNDAMKALGVESLLVASTKDAISLSAVTTYRVVTGGAFINRGFIAKVDEGFAVGWM